MDQIHLEGRELVNERLTMGPGTLYFLGPNLTLRNCTLVLRVSARSLVIPQARLIDCTIEARKELKNFRWEHAFLKGCRFTGRFAGNDFGRWPDSSPERQGGIEDCDLTAAHLDGCRFVGCDASTLRFPPWPCFTLLDPLRRLGELNARSWPGELRIAWQALAHASPQTVAITESAKVLAKEFNASEADIKATLEKLGGVIF